MTVALVQQNRIDLVPDQGKTPPQLHGHSLPTLSALVRSRVAEESLHADKALDDWIDERLANPRLTVSQLPLAAMKRWAIDPESGNIVHETGRFFTFTGVEVRHRTSSGELEWDQPIIDQPEFGILGILAKTIDGVMHFCLQAKEEPGNINSVQLSPTVQATFSNYTCAHGGNAPLFVDYFLAPQRENLIFGKLQTEDGGRFLYKSNRNMIVRVGDTELEQLPEGFIWVTLRQIARLMKQDNLIHATTRSVISALLLPALGDADCHNPFPWDSAGAYDLAETIQWLDDRKAANHMLVKRKGLNSLKEWSHGDDGVFIHQEGRFFKIMGIEVAASGREVAGWHQPIIANMQPGVIGMLTRIRQGKRHFLIQAKAEAGNRSIVQIGPTVQFSTVNYQDNPRLQKPFLYDEFANPGRFPVLSESMQAEEGARFFRETNCHRVLLLPERTELDIPVDFRWISEDALRFFLNWGEMVNSCSRSIIACLI
ncbi:NDP-hexose 2,3-dehydratase family protein [Geobacter pelophilus]|uniref:NDP-hexose 2,3-dehydratase family protein n=1 Tax=Geoanaerobacter pelophilus TaxID=60036 RepID=A0AAW4L9S5_9BACT|nr:NDP-hexose 2,3-dehydratase family protein [Geoanaerobacter pelophilus]MBT0665305.1 NDP-hexose 2,3-dehydratase family protein [Geoanaerobacter pelophilus]